MNRKSQPRETRDSANRTREQMMTTVVGDTKLATPPPTVDPNAVVREDAITVPRTEEVIEQALKH